MTSSACPECTAPIESGQDLCGECDHDRDVANLMAADERPCPDCGAAIPIACTPHNDWACHVQQLRDAGYREHLPNGLPVRCANAFKKLLLECEGGDHPDYLFPVDVGWEGPPIRFTREDGEVLPRDRTADCFPEDHALIYTDGYVAVTLWEYCYHVFLVGNGKAMIAEYAGRVLTPEARAKIVAYVQAKQAPAVEES